MKKVFIFFLLCSAFLPMVKAQHSVMNFSDEPININQRSLLIIPFEPFMFQSDINRELSNEKPMDGAEICKRFAKGIDQSFQSVFQKRCDVNSFYFLDETRRFQDLSFVFENRKLEYVSASTHQVEKPVGIKGLFGKKAEEEKNGIHNGQIVTAQDNSEKYMKAIANQLLVDSLSRQFNSDFLLFVNQLDIKNIYGSVYEMSNMEYEREISIHYTLYSTSGKILSTGISSARFPATENNIDRIISKYFPNLAKNIYKDLFSSSGVN